jgi:hypothetical protein
VSLAPGDKPSLDINNGGVVVVTEDDVARQAEGTPTSNNWVLYTRAGTPKTAAAFVARPDAPLGAGGLQLATLSGSEKVCLFNYDHVGTKLAEVSAIGYSTYRSSGSSQQVAALNVVIDFNGPNVDGGFSTLVFEPVYNTEQGAVVSGQWQTWNGLTGTWWSTREINGQCAGATSACDKTWNEIVANNPDATILGGVGINQGSGNDGLTSIVDAFTFDDVTYDFEPYRVAADVNACKDGGWKIVKRADGSSFKNQGDCVSYVARR